MLSAHLSRERFQIFVALSVHLCLLFSTRLRSSLSR